MSARFRFRLEGLLRLRKSLEEAARRNLAVRIAERDGLQTKLQHLELQHREAVEARRLNPGEALDLDRWKAIERFLVVQEHRIAQTEQALQEAEARIDSARQELTKAHQDHLMLVRLKERRQSQHDLEALHEETVLLDEIAVLRHRLHPATALSVSQVSP